MNVIFQDNFSGMGDLVLDSDLTDTGAYYTANGGVGYLNIMNTVGDAGILYAGDVLPRDFRITIGITPMEVTGYLGALVAGVPAVAGKTVFDATRRAWAWSNGWDTLHFCVKDAEGNIRTWDGDSWETGTVVASVSSYTQTGDYRLTVEKSPDRMVRFTLYDDTGAVLEQTDWVSLYGASTNEDIYFLTGYPYEDEPFSGGYGFDGTQIEPCYYKATGDTATLTVNNKLVFNCGSAGKTAYVDFVNGVNIVGDFDVQFDFNQPTLSAAAGDPRYLMLSLVDIDDPTTYCMVYKYLTSAVHRYYFHVYVAGVAVSITYVATTATAGKLRIVRSGTAVTGYYWNGSAWVSIASYASFRASNLYPQFRFSSNAAANVYEIDNFTVTTGTVELINRSQKYNVVSGYEIEFSPPEYTLCNKIGFREVDFPTVWGGDSLEIVNAIRSEMGAEFDLFHRIGRDFIDADFTVINTIGDVEAVVQPVVTLLLDGAACPFTRFEISENIDRTPNQITIDIPDEALYRIKQMYVRSDEFFSVPRITVYMDGLLYDSYYWEDLKMSETPRGTTWQIWGRNAAARLFMPYAAKITEVYDTTTRMNLMTAVAAACGLTLDYRVADFTIPGGLLVVEDEYPMTLLQRLAEADGAVVRSGRGDAIVVRYREWVIDTEATNGVAV